MSFDFSKSSTIAVAVDAIPILVPTQALRKKRSDGITDSSTISYCVLGGTTFETSSVNSRSPVG